MQKYQCQNARDLPGCQLGIEWEEEGGQRSARGRHRLPPRGSFWQEHRQDLSHGEETAVLR